MLRRTESYSLFVQQFGRALRLLLGKTHAIIFDHVGNVSRHSLPDVKNTWTLDRRDKRKRKQRDPDDIPVRVCVKCTGVYERLYSTCPYCGWEFSPAKRSGPEQVDGVLTEIDTGFSNQLKAKAIRANLNALDYEKKLREEQCPEIGIKRNVRAHEERKRVRGILDTIILMWRRQYAGESEENVQKRFYWQTGCDMLSAQSLDEKETRGVAECLILKL